MRPFGERLEDMRIARGETIAVACAATGLEPVQHAIRMKTTELNKSLRHYRLASRLSVAEVSSKSGVPAETIKRLEAGDIRWSRLNQLHRIASALSLRVTIELTEVER